MRVAFYKGTKTGIPGIYNRGVRWWTIGKYSHCELIFKSGMSASSSFADGGVRYKFIDYDPEKWDFIDLPDSFEDAARKWFDDHIGQEYDLMGNFHFVVSAVPDDKSKWFCNEAVGAALGIQESWRFYPDSFYIVVKSLSELSKQFTLAPLMVTT